MAKRKRTHLEKLTRELAKSLTIKGRTEVIDTNLAKYGVVMLHGSGHTWTVQITIGSRVPDDSENSGRRAFRMLTQAAELVAAAKTEIDLKGWAAEDGLEDNILDLAKVALDQAVD